MKLTVKLKSCFHFDCQREIHTTEITEDILNNYNYKQCDQPSLLLVGCASNHTCWLLSSPLFFFPSSVWFHTSDGSTPDDDAFDNFKS